MYTHYAVSKGWDLNIVSELSNYPYGSNRSILEIKGAFVGYFLQFEAGIHQVKRRASTVSNSTKIHTSTATVTVIPMMQLGIHPSQLKLTTSPIIYHPQRTNTLGIDLYHHPTGIRIICDRCSSLYKNKEKAMEIMQAVLHKLNYHDLSVEYPNSSIVRTYNFEKNCAKDSSGITFPLSEILEGHLDLSFAAHPNNHHIM
jgi:peptide chain release factor 1